MDHLLIFQLFTYLMLFVLLRIAYEKLWDPDGDDEKELKIKKGGL